LCILSSSYAETLWFWDLTEEPSGWSHGDYWDFTDSGANLYYSDTNILNLTTSLFSNDLYLPPSVEGKDLNISFTHSLDYLGTVYDFEMWTDIEARVFLNSDISYVYAYNEYVYAPVHWWDSLYTEDFGEKTLLLNSVHEGDLLSIEFYFRTQYSGVINTTFIDWTITDLTVETVSTSLEQHTWGSIKNSF
jgi:hypothetical protein